MALFVFFKKKTINNATTMKPDKKERKEALEAQDALDYPGADINIGDDEKESPELVKERTKTLNNNPRNTDDKMP